MPNLPLALLLVLESIPVEKSTADHHMDNRSDRLLMCLFAKINKPI